MHEGPPSSTGSQKYSYEYYHFSPNNYKIYIILFLLRIDVRWAGYAHIRLICRVRKENRL